MPSLPGLDGVEQRSWQQFLGCSLNLVAALNGRLKGTHNLSIRDVLLLELLSKPNRQARRLCALAETLRVSQGSCPPRFVALKGRA